jgi:hypothetical protein
LLEAQREDSPLGLWERPHCAAERLALLDASQGGILTRCRQRRQAPVLVVKCGGAVGIAGDPRLEHLIFGERAPRRQLRRRWMPTQLEGHQGQLAPDLQPSLLEISGHVDAPAKVAPMALECTRDRRNRVCLEVHASVGIEAFQGAEQRQVGHLEQIVDWLSWTPELMSETAGERHHALEELIARAAVIVCARSCQQPAFTCAPRRAAGSCAGRSVVHGQPAHRTGDVVQQSAPLSWPARRIGWMATGWSYRRGPGMVAFRREERPVQRGGRDLLVLSQHR